MTKIILKEDEQLRARMQEADGDDPLKAVLQSMDPYGQRDVTEEDYAGISLPCDSTDFDPYIKIG